MKTYHTILPIMSPFGFAGRFVGMTIIMTMAADKVSGGGRVIASLLFRGKIRGKILKIRLLGLVGNQLMFISFFNLSPILHRFSRNLSNLTSQ